MDFGLGDGNGSGHDQEDSNSRRGTNRSYQRHSAHQTQQLEAFFNECPNPDGNQRNRLARDLGLEPLQIKFWFQNKRIQTRTQHDRANNSALRADNERLYCENLAMTMALNNLVCTAGCCGAPLNNEEDEPQQRLDSLKWENAELKEKHEELSFILSEHTGRPVSEILAWPLLSGPPVDASMGSFPTQMGMPIPSTHDLDVTPGPSGYSSMPFNLEGISDLEKSFMTDAATGAIEELLQLLITNEPLWIKSTTSGKYFLHSESYENLFPKAFHFRRSTTAQVESSKDCCLATVRGEQLVEMFVDPNKWVDLFPTIVTKASTIHVLETGLGNDGGSLQLMYAQMHTLSPLVAPREFYILRNCQNVKLGMWVIADVSYECSRENQYIIPSRCWRLPSGCMIEDIPDGCCKVTWVEHVEVEDKTSTHRLYRYLVNSGAAFGAERWTTTLQRMCERFTYSIEESPSMNEIGGVITSPEGKRGMKKLAHRMVKNFCAMLSMPNKMEFPHPPRTNSSGVQVSVRINMELGQPKGTIVTAATSLWLPLSPEDVFNFFRDERTRAQWDTLSNSNPVHEIARIANGTLPGNSISVIQSYIPNENQTLALQESSIDHLGSLIIYAPIDVSAISVAVSGEDTSNIPLLPSGLIISGDGHAQIASGASSSIHSNRSSGGSLLTVALQILVCSASSSRQLDTGSVSTITSLMSSTVQRIKIALNCDDID